MIYRILDNFTEMMKILFHITRPQEVWLSHDPRDAWQTILTRFSSMKSLLGYFPIIQSSIFCEIRTNYEERLSAWVFKIKITMEHYWEDDDGKNHLI